MQTKILRYHVLIKKEDKYYVAYVPALGISDFAKSVTAAKKNVQGAIKCHIEGLIKTKSEVPPPDTDEFYISESEIILDKPIRFAL